MGVGVGAAHYVQTDIERQCGKCKYARQGGFLCAESKMQENKAVPTDEETGFKLVHPTMGCCDEWDPGKGVDLMQKAPPRTLKDYITKLARGKK